MVTKLDTKFPTCMEPKCSLQYSQQPNNGNYTNTILQFSPTPINYEYSLLLTYPQSSHKGENTNHEMIPCSLFSQCYLQQTEPNISASEHITSTHQIISVTQYPNERYFFVCISVCQFC